MQNYALVRAGVVENIAVVDNTTEDGQHFLSIVGHYYGYDAAIAVTDGQIGQHVDDQGNLIPLPTLTVDPKVIPPDGITYSVATYLDMQPDAPSSVAFTVNEETSGVMGLVQGASSIAIVSTTPGDIITVTAAGLSTTVEVTP